MRALRYYEERGLLNPERGNGGYRAYNERDVTVVGRVQALISAGLNTELIAQVLHCFSDGGGGHELTPTCSEMVVALSAAHDRMTARITDLETSRELLGAIISAAPAASDGSGPEPEAGEGAGLGRGPDQTVAGV